MKKWILISVLSVFMFSSKVEASNNLYIGSNYGYSSVNTFDMKAEMNMNYMMQKRTSSRINSRSPMRNSNPSSFNHGKEWLGLGVLVIVTAGVNAGYFFVHHLRPEDKKALTRNYDTGKLETHYQTPWKFNICALAGGVGIVTYNLTIGKNR